MARRPPGAGANENPGESGQLAPDSRSSRSSLVEANLGQEVFQGLVANAPFDWPLAAEPPLIEQPVETCGQAFASLVKFPALSYYGL
jgi:hypothetical protein